MLQKLASKIVGSRNDRYIKGLKKTILTINALADDMAALSDEALRDKTSDFKSRLEKGETLDQILPEAFAVCREASSRVLGMHHYDVQLIGGIVLHQGKISEMRTGEGKTLVATLAAYLNALTGNGVHVVTVNDYLARRDAAWMGELYAFLGLTTGVCVGGMSPEEKNQTYNSDIVYGTNNELGFDYLRTNMALTPEERIQKQLNFAIIDEVDSILIDEARTPLIISGATNEDTDIYRRLNNIIPHLTRQIDEDNPGDFSVDEKDRQVGFTDDGHDKVEKLLTDAGLMVEGESIYNPANIALFHHLNACLRAHNLYQKNVDYIVQDGEVVIVDEFTGRTMPGRRWSEGLHQAIEAKEGLTIQNENQTLASITFQNYFRMYKKLAGMTGTADTEAFEFQQIYGLETIVIPTNKPIKREDMADAIYLNQQGKFRAVVEDIKDKHAKGQPVLVGTTSIEVSELIGEELKKTGIHFELLNAKQHEREADIVANAGRKGAVTIATNMAGRGTDIVLGGSLDNRLEKLDNPSDAEVEKVKAEWKAEQTAVLEAGGLHIIGTERHESRRIDNQLRGRSGRQGDPGSSKFYLSLEDNLIRIFASQRMAGMMQKLGMTEDEAIEHRMLSNAIENAQRKVESHNFDIRKNIIEYDDVANEQRKVIYGQRNEIMESEDVSEMIDNMRDGSVSLLVDNYIPENSILEEWDKDGLEQAVITDTGLTISVDELLTENDSLQSDDIKSHIIDTLKTGYQQKVESIDNADPENYRRFEKMMLLRVVDNKWREHLKQMDYLRQGIGLRAVRAQKDPRQEYKREAFYLFEGLLDTISEETTRFFSLVEFRQQPTPIEELKEEQQVKSMTEQHDSVDALHPEATNQTQATEQTDKQYQGIGRNEPCPCGSGKKFKHCHGKAS